MCGRKKGDCYRKDCPRRCFILHVGPYPVQDRGTAWRSPVREAAKRRGRGRVTARRAWIPVRQSGGLSSAAAAGEGALGGGWLGREQAAGGGRREATLCVWACVCACVGVLVCVCVSARQLVELDRRLFLEGRELSSSSSFVSSLPPHRNEPTFSFSPQPAPFHRTR